jgi:hypothetical protein
MKWAGHVTRTGEMRDACKILVEKPEDQRKLVRLISVWEDNIKMDLRETGLKDVDRIHLAQERDR